MQLLKPVGDILHWQRCRVCLCWTDVDIPRSPVDYGWYCCNWVAVTLPWLCWTWQPDCILLLIESLRQRGGDGWQKGQNNQSSTWRSTKYAPLKHSWSLLFPQKRKATQTRLTPLIFFIFTLLGCCLLQRPGQRCHQPHLRHPLLVSMKKC